MCHPVCTAIKKRYEAVVAVLGSGWHKPRSQLAAVLEGLKNTSAITIEIPDAALSDSRYGNLSCPYRPGKCVAITSVGSNECWP